MQLQSPSGEAPLRNLSLRLHMIRARSREAFYWSEHGGARFDRAQISGEQEEAEDRGGGLRLSSQGTLEEDGCKRTSFSYLS